MTEEKSVSISFHPEAADFRRVLLWYQWKRLVAIPVTWLILSFVIFYFVGYGAGADPFDPKENAAVIAVTLLLMLPFLMAASIYFGIYRQAKKIEKIAEQVSITFSGSGIETVAESSSSRRSWDGINKVVETKDDFIFLPKENVFYTVPRRFFSTHSQAEELKELLKANLGQRAKLRS